MRPQVEDIVVRAAERLTSQFKQYDAVKGFSYSSISSAPYPNISADRFYTSVSLNGVVSLTDIVLNYGMEFDSQTATAAPISGVLLDVAYRYTTDTDSQTAQAMPLSAELRDVVISYIAPVEDAVISSGMIVGGTLDDVVVEYTPPASEFDAVISAGMIVGGSLG